MGDATNQNNRERVIDEMQRGRITAAEANVRMVREERVRLIFGSVPREVRKALNAAVKEGKLGHFRKDGLLPEAYFHPEWEQRAIAERNAYSRQSISALAKVYAPRRLDDEPQQEVQE